MIRSKNTNKLTSLLAILLVLALIISSLAGCSDKNGGASNSANNNNTGNNSTSNNGVNNNGTTAQPDGDLPEIISETIRISEYPAPFGVSRNATALAAQQYITARLYLNALIEFDWDTGTVEEFAELYDGTIEQFALAEEYAALAVGAADLAQIYMDSGGVISGVSYNQGQGSGEVSFLSYRPGGDNPFMLTALAAGSPKGADELRAWAKDIEKTANDASQVYGEKGVVGTLAKQLGVDSKTAGEMLKQAKTINEGAAAESAAFWWGLGGDAADYGMKTAMATSTGCKVSLIVLGTVASGGVAGVVAEGALATTALIVSGADAIIEVAATTSTIVLGENNSVTATLNEVQDYIAPVAAVTGLLTLNVSKAEKAGEAIAYIGGSLVDFFQNDKLVGVDIQTIKDGAGFAADVTVVVAEMGFSNLTTGDAAQASRERVYNDLRENRFPALPKAGETPPAPKPLLEKANETAPKTPVKSVEEYLSELIDWMEENGYVSSELAAELRTKYLGGAANYEGMYSGTYNSITEGIEETPGTSSGNSTVEVLLSDEASNTYTVLYTTQSNVYTFSGQIINGHFYSGEAAYAVQYHEVVNSTTISIDFSGTGDSLSGTIVRLGTLNGLSFTQTVTIDMIKQ